jgi:hypothetical protein
MSDPHSESLPEGKNEPAAPLRRSRKAARVPGEAVVAAEEATRAVVPEVSRVVAPVTTEPTRVVSGEIRAVSAEGRRQGWEGTISRALIAHSPLALFLGKAG